MKKKNHNYRIALNVCVLIVALSILRVDGENVFSTLMGPDYMDELMYQNFWGYPCVRLVGTDGPIGCTTSKTGQYGWIYPIFEDKELEHFIAKGASGPIVVVMPSDLFIQDNVNRLGNCPADVQGVLVYLRDTPPDGFSPGSSDPNKQYGLYPNSTYTWNPLGDAWNYEVQPFPIFAIDNSTFNYLEEYLEYNMRTNSYPKHAIRLSDAMYTRKDTTVEECLRRGDCSPLGGKNIWALLSPLSQDKEIVLSISSMDANAFFHDLAVGADAISGTIALMAAIEALTHVDNSVFTKQPMFTIFNGESYGYIGSKAFVNDLQNFTCIEPKSTYCRYPFRIDLNFQNLSLNNFSSIIELNQIGLLEKSTFGNNFEPIFIHTDPLNIADSANLLQTIYEASQKLSVPVATTNTTLELPSSSLMSFLSANRNQAGVVITEFNREFKNKFFQSSYDKTVNTEGICNVALLLARSVYLLATDSIDSDTIPESLVTNCNIVEEITECLTQKYNCKLIKELYPTLSYEGDLPPVSNYVGTYERSSHNFLTLFVRDWIANITSTEKYGIKCTDNSNCTQGECITGQCIGGFYAYFHDALSPAFEYQYGTGYVLKDSSPQWPQWTESYWESPYLTIFWMDWPWLGVIVLLFGVTEFVFCIAIVYFTSRMLKASLKND